MSLDKHGFLSPEMTTLIAACRQRHLRYFALATEVNEFCQTSMSEFPVCNDQKLLVAVLCIRVLTNYQSVILLCERGMNAEARAMLRVMLEAVVKLCAIAKNPKLAKDFTLEDQKERFRSLKNLRESHGGQLPPDVDAEEFEQLERELEAERTRKRTTKEWADEAGLLKWYLGAYSVLSASVHAGVRDLLEHYVVTDGQGNISFKWGLDERGIRQHLVTAIEAILVGFGCADSLFKLNKNEKIDEFRRRLQELHPSS